MDETAEPAEDNEQELLRSRLGLDPDEPCPSPACFEYAERVMPRRGYLEVEEGVIGVYDRKGEIVTALPLDFDPYAPVPCESCSESTLPIDLRCEGCGEKIDPAWVWSFWYGDSEDEEHDEGDEAAESAGAVPDRVRLAAFGDRSDAIEVARTLRDAGVPFELVDEEDDSGVEVTAVWIDRMHLGTAQNAIARPGVEG